MSAVIQLSVGLVDCHACEHCHNYVIHSPVGQEAHPSPDFSASTCQSCVTLFSLTVQTLTQC